MFQADAEWTNPMPSPPTQQMIINQKMSIRYTAVKWLEKDLPVA